MLGEPAPFTDLHLFGPLQLGPGAWSAFPAAMFVGGASISTAQAADPNPAGLVVTTVANYVGQCNNGNGWTKRG